MDSKKTVSYLRVSTSRQDMEKNNRCSSFRQYSWFRKGRICRGNHERAGIMEGEENQGPDRQPGSWRPAYRSWVVPPWEIDPGNHGSESAVKPPSSSLSVSFPGSSVGPWSSCWSQQTVPLRFLRRFQWHIFRFEQSTGVTDMRNSGRPRNLARWFGGSVR